MKEVVLLVCKRKINREYVAFWLELVAKSVRICMARLSVDGDVVAPTLPAAMVTATSRCSIFIWFAAFSCEGRSRFPLQNQRQFQKMAS